MPKRGNSKQDKQQKSIIENYLQQINLRSIKVNFKSPKMFGGVVIAGLIISGSLFYAINNANAAYIVIDGQQIGMVASEAAGKSLVQSVLEESGKPVNQIAKTNREIEYQKVRVDDSTLLKESVTKEELRAQLDPYVEGYALQVAGSTVAVLPTPEDAEKVLLDLKSYYAQSSDSKKVTSVEFEESVATEKVEAQPDQIQSPDQVLELLQNGNEKVQEYTVQANDSLWIIARKNNMLVEEVLKSNPDLTEDTVLQLGQKLKLASVTPYINVISKGEYSATETIPYTTIRKTDYNLGSGQAQVKQQGSEGSKVVTYSFVQKNDKITEKTVLAERKLKEPVDKVIVQGPANVRVAQAPSSAISRGAGPRSGFIWPLSGPITSPFGWRKSGFHGAIDIGAPSGKPIVAAAGGTVISAGWNGNYGLSILIDNGNGIKTRYSDNSKLLVKAGQRVEQGQKIALVGSTGNSTGPHLDFEIIINGVRVDPLKYLP